MAATKKKVTYTEPAGYFTADMIQVAQEWDKAHAGKTDKKPAGKKPAEKKPAKTKTAATGKAAAKKK